MEKIESCGIAIDSKIKEMVRKKRLWIDGDISDEELWKTNKEFQSFVGELRIDKYSICDTLDSKIICNLAEEVENFSREGRPLSLYSVKGVESSYQVVILAIALGRFLENFSVYDLLSKDRMDDELNNLKEEEMLWARHHLTSLIENYIEL